MIELYDYQKSYINELRRNIKQGNKNLILCSATGSGKTVMFSYMTKSAIDRGRSVLVFTHRSELLIQAGGAFTEFGLSPEFIEAGTSPDLSNNLHVAMVETFSRRMDEYKEFLNSRDVIIFDEAHLQNFNKILDEINNPNVVIIGATATPYRKGKKERCLSENYSKIVQIIDIPDLIEKGKLSPAISYGVDINMKGLKKRGNDYDTAQYYEENKTYEGVVKNYELHSKGDKTILFASNIESSKKVCEEFIKQGYDARHVDAKSKDRSDIFGWFDNTDNAILCNCGIATTGFDQKDIKCVILYRATTSLPLFLQMCGRGSRIYPNKENFKILDFGNNIKRHGFWEQPREWQLKKTKTKTKEAESPVKECPSCMALNYASARECSQCGYKFKSKEEKEKEVVLKELKQKNITGKLISELSIGDLIYCQDRKILKSAFVWRIIRSRGSRTLSYYAKLKGYTDGWVYKQNEMIAEGQVTFKNYRINENRI